MRQKMAIFKEGNSVCRGTKNFQISFYLHKEFSGGAMRQKIAIFKGRNSVCRVAKFFQISRCDRKWRFSKRETAFAGVQKIFRSHFIYTKNFQGGDATAFFFRTRSWFVLKTIPQKAQVLLHPMLPNPCP